MEMMVAIGLFSLVMLLTTGAFLKFMALDKVARYTSDVTNNLSFAVDSMSRSIRMGTNYQCNGGTNCWPAGGSTFSYTNEQGKKITYLLRSDGSIGRCSHTNNCTSDTAVSLTDKRITITSLNFAVRGVGGSPDVIQPRVLITIDGELRPEPDAAAIDFTIQTMAVQRYIDL